MGDHDASSKLKKAPRHKETREQKRFARQLELVRLTMSEAHEIAQESAGDDDMLHRALARMVQSQLFAILAEMDADAGDESGNKSEQIHAIARTICAMNKQEIEMERWRAEARERVGVGVSAAAASVEEARASGLTAEAADKIRNALLEIKL